MKSRRNGLWAALILIGAGLAFFLFVYHAGGRPGFANSPYPFAVSEKGEDTLAADIAFYEERVKRDPHGSVDLASLAEFYVTKGKATGSSEAFDKAEAAANKSLKNRSADNPVARLVLADVYQARHEFARAITIGNDLLRAYPDGTPILQVLLTCHLALGNLQEAERLSTRLALLHPSQGTFIYRALVLEAAGRNEEAEHVFQEALKRDLYGETASAAWARDMFARFYLNLGKPGPAEKLVRESLRISPNDTLALGLLARAQELKGESALAEKTYRQAFELSRQAAFLAGEGRALQRRDPARGALLREQAESLLRSDLGKNGYGHRAELVHLLLEKNGAAESFTEAFSLAEAEAKERPTADSFLLLAEAGMKTDQLVRAREASQAALATGVRRVSSYELASKIEEALGNKRAAALYHGLAEKLRAQ